MRPCLHVRGLVDHLSDGGYEMTERQFNEFVGFVLALALCAFGVMAAFVTIYG